MLRRGTLLAAALVIALVGAACSDEPTVGDGETTATTTAGTTTPPSDEETGDGGGATTITQQNFAFTPRDVEVATGTTITVRNGNPSTPHTFTVDGTEIDVVNNGGESAEVTIDLEPGTYDFECRFHPSQMQGTLTVA